MFCLLFWLVYLVPFLLPSWSKCCNNTIFVTKSGSYLVGSKKQREKSGNLRKEMTTGTHFSKHFVIGV